MTEAIRGALLEALANPMNTSMVLGYVDGKGGVVTFVEGTVTNVVVIIRGLEVTFEEFAESLV